MGEILDSRAYRSVTIALFALLLFAPLFGRLAGVGSDVAEIELRDPAPQPALPRTLAALDGFPKQLEAHLDDTFGFRSQLVTAHSLLHLALGVSGSQRYILGKEGWFFHREVSDILDQARGVNLFSPPELERWIRDMEKRQRWLARRGAEFLIVIAPSKHTIYPEYLPEWVNKIGPTRHDQLMRRLRKGSSLQVLDLRGPMLRAKGDEPLYFRTDGHWNDLGAFVAYRAIGEWIAARHPQVRVLSRQDFDLVWSSEATGTITRGLNVREFVREEVPHLELRGKSNVVTEKTLGTGPNFEWDTVVVSRTGLKRAPKVMFIRDSFATPVARFLQETVRNVVLVHHRLGGFSKEEVKRFAPDIVIYEMVERGLPWRLYER